MKKLTALFCLLFSLSLWASIDVLEFDSAQQQQDYHSLTQQLRCPQCQNNNIADSNATIAVDMRHKVLELLKQGQSKQEVVDYMVQRYGNFVSYDPPITFSTIILWIAPILLIALGILLVFKKSRHTANPSSTTELNLEQQQRLANILKNEEKQ
ncbi:cytochrome c-type biogenesis protein CcmH [Volucribacter psittacicida]|uniref:Cytochrome c-type biogenesis protein n=1 Tax=Volucribacter psittacicida TaxID=203482 RepID=A0A4R1FN70_9PAST|nr:cytochrome c-type biogenesis protein [Volucribacter psittacicida]TCJ94844.1 cytochrome c-type biogenesis protein CcmH [Volucribacter psittacicida]